MNRLVYLFELDSVRKYENTEKIGVLYTPGVRALFCEIIKHGNCVAITMNQLTDSQFIREAITDDVAYGCLLRLFELGALKLSLYGKIRTASQYIQQAVQKCLDDTEDSFIFSNLPVDSDNKALLTQIKDALQFSDLAWLKAEAESANGENALKMKTIYRFVNMILQVSVCETSNIPPKPAGNKEFSEFLDRSLEVLAEPGSFASPFGAVITEAVQILKKRGESITDGRNNRSNWLNVNAPQGSAEHIANEIIHICYNYTLEDSINGVSKHYDSDDFDSTFQKDLIRRVSLYCNENEMSPNEMQLVSCADWHAVVRFAEYKAGCKQQERECGAPKVYEDGFHQEKMRWISFMLQKSLAAFAAAFMYIVIFCVVDFGTSWMEDHFFLSLDSIFISSVLSIVLFGILGSLIGYVLKIINKGDDMPDILESMISIAVHFCDFWRALGGSNDSYKLP